MGEFSVARSDSMNPAVVVRDSGDVQNQDVGMSSDSTQTEGEEGDDVVDGEPLLNRNITSNGFVNGDERDGGFLSSLFTMVLPVKKRDVVMSENGNLQSRSIGTQTDEDPIALKGQQLSHLLIQELSLQNSVPASSKDEVFESLATCICDMLVKHSILFNGMVRRCQVTRYHIFCCIANEIFEASETGHFNVTWGRIISLFAFAVRLAQEYSEDQEQVSSITRFLAAYVTKHLVPFVRLQGGWENLVEHYPAPIDEDAQVKRALIWSGLCVGLMATMYVSSYLSSR